MVALVFQFAPPLKELPWWGVVLVTVAAVFFCIYVGLEVMQRNPYRAFRKDNAKAIRTYMHKWIEPGRRVAIWTRDMSWADDETTRTLLAEKASNNELILCISTVNDLTRELRALGAEVCYLGEYLESPASRFTIADFGRDGSAVAVGRTVGDKHVIEEFSAGEHPAYHIAADLVAIVRKQPGSLGMGS